MNVIVLPLFDTDTIVMTPAASAVVASTARVAMLASNTESFFTVTTP